MRRCRALTPDRLRCGRVATVQIKTLRSLENGLPGKPVNLCNECFLRSSKHYVEHLTEDITAHWPATGAGIKAKRAQKRKEEK